ncbi:MAG: hypothetical protein Unbinned6242contig1001_24 [Prokaryotic dsDNA virus sp.]|mgnify:CR=1 FL=1|nr:MAG: hypothetical protein Unbinned6242contig1001_24 [Prokaryotic dsDNA virus sp.]
MKSDLDEIKHKLSELSHYVERHIQISEINHNNLMSQVVQQSKTLYGTNGSPGLDKRVDRIETTSKLISKVSWSGLMAGLGAFGSFFLGIFKSD